MFGRILPALIKCSANIVKHGQESFTAVRMGYSQLVRSVMTMRNQDDFYTEAPTRGLVLGVYCNEDDGSRYGILTPTACKFNQLNTNCKLIEFLKLTGPIPRRGECRILYGLEMENSYPMYSAVAIVGLGKESLGYNSYEKIDEGKEAIRTAAGVGCMALQSIHVNKVDVESFGHAESAAEGAALGTWVYQEHRRVCDRVVVPSLDMFSYKDDECDWEGWKIGLQKAAAQNLARQLQETPANLLTPTNFAQNVVEILCKSGVNVEVKVSGWAEAQQMNSFLAVARASCEPPIFVEISYYGACPEERPIVLIGQGITYDTGGLCLKDFEQLKRMRGDMTGAAVVVATCRAVAGLRLPVNIRGLIPLCENMLGCNAYKPGDVYKALNGKNIKVNCTDHDDVLVLADALLYAQNFSPKFIVDIGTTTEELCEGLDEAATGVWTNSEYMWQVIKNAGVHTGCRVWKFPLYNCFTEQLTSCPTVDIETGGKGKYGKACKFAAFLKEFVPCGQWMHIDASNVMITDGYDCPYLRKGMAGRPTRTLIEFIAQTVCADQRPRIPEQVY